MPDGRPAAEVPEKCGDISGRTDRMDSAGVSATLLTALLVQTCNSCREGSSPSALTTSARRQFPFSLSWRHFSTLVFFSVGRHEVRTAKPKAVVMSELA
jgi:hypothetical protein